MSGSRGGGGLKLSIYSGERDQVFPKTLDLKADGVEEILFDPFEVPDGESVRLTLTAKAGDGSRTRWSSRSRSAPGASRRSPRPRARRPTTRRSSSACRPGRTYESPEMRIDVSPTLRRLLIELALGRRFRREGQESPELRSRSSGRSAPDTVADRASDLIAATSALNYLRGPDPRRPRGRPAFGPNSGAGERAGHGPERRRRLAVGRRAGGAVGSLPATGSPRRRWHSHSGEPGKSG